MKQFLWYSTSLRLTIVSFHLITSPKFPVILSISWFSTHQLGSTDHIFYAPQCEKHCTKPFQKSSPPTTKSQVNVVTYPVILYDNLLPQYHELQDACDKKNADQLPPHCPYDCSIKLIPVAEIHFGCIFNLSEPEVKVLRV